MSRKYILTILLIIALVVPCLADVTVSFAAAGINTEQDIFVYKVNVTSLKADLVGQYNTTSAYIPLNDSTSYIFTVKPSTNSDLSQPDTAAAAFLNMMQTNWKGMATWMFIICGGLVFLAVALGRRRKH